MRRLVWAFDGHTYQIVENLMARLKLFFLFINQDIIEPRHEISNNVGPAKAQTSLRIRAVWSEPLLDAWIF